MTSAVQAAARPRQQLRPRLAALLALLGGCWLLVIGMTLSEGGHSHGQNGPAHTGPMGPVALLGVLLGWQVMTLAMMGPSCLPAARYVAMNTLRPARTVPAFLGGYLLVWGGYLVLVGVAYTALLRIPGAAELLAQHSTVLPAAVLLAAAAWQLTPVKRAGLRHCRSGPVLPAAGYRADVGAVRFGTRHGLGCVGSCGPMMLIMLAVSSGQLWWMIALGGLIWLEKTHRLGRRLAVPSAAGFALLAVMLPVFAG